MFLVSKL